MPTTGRQPAPNAAKPPVSPAWKPSHSLQTLSAVPTRDGIPAPWNKGGATARENSPYRSHIAPLAGQNSPCSHKMAQFGSFYPCRENFIPLSPATSRAGRTFSRTSPSTITGLIETTPQHDTPSGAMKHFPPQLHTPHRSMKHLSPQRATNDPKSPISPTQGRTFFHNTHHPHNTHPRLGDFSFNPPRQVQANWRGLGFSDRLF